MKFVIQYINSNTRLAKAFSWSKVIALTGSAQIMIQIISLACGLMIIRLVPVQSYAYYTLANTMLGTMTILSDAGIAAGVMAQGGKVWANRDQLGSVVATGLRLRKKFAIASAAVTLPILFFLLLHNHAPLYLTILIVLAIIPAFYAALSDTLLEVAPKLTQDIFALQKNQLATHFLRLVLTCAGIIIFPLAYIPIIASGISRIWGNFKLERITAKYADLSQDPNTKAEAEMLKLVKRILPGAIYFCFSGQITIWLISIFGTTNSIAEIGALGRISVVFTVIPTIVSTLISPRFARLAADRKLITFRFLQVQFAMILLSVIIVGIVILFANQLLWVLGRPYMGLQHELVLMTASVSIGMIGGVIHDVSLARGIILPPILNIGANIASQIILLCILDLSNLKGVLLFSIYNFSVNVVMAFFYFLYRIQRK